VRIVIALLVAAAAFASAPVLSAEQPPEPPPTYTPSPHEGRTANLLPVTGTVYIKLPGTKAFVLITQPIQVPIGTIIDATHGSVTLVFGLPNGKTQTILLYGGEFRVASQNPKGLVTIALYGPLHNALYSQVHGVMLARSALYAPIKDLLAHAHHPKKVKTRSLWGSDNHGSYTTQGTSGAATVRGTVWLTEDFRGYSRFYVAKGTLTIKDFHHKHRKIKLRAGHCYQTSTPKHCTPSHFERSGR
jgi:hypothetical protein